MTARSQLQALHRQMDACRACPGVVGPVVHGPITRSRIFLIGQAPGPHEGSLGRPFAWTAGKTMFGWFEKYLGVQEAAFREQIYMAAVLRCFPGKAPGGADRKPSREETERCRSFLVQEIALLKPRLLLPVGTMAIEQVLGEAVPLVEVVGKTLQLTYHGQSADVICLPHPSGASTWHRMEPGITLLKKAMGLVARHPEVVAAFGARPVRSPAP